MEGGETEEGKNCSKEILQILQETDHLSKPVMHSMMYKLTSSLLKGFVSHEPDPVKKCGILKSLKATN